MTGTFSYTSTYPFDVETVRAWFNRPGALTRATPHWAGQVRKEGNPQAPGSRALTTVALPLTYGLVALPWEARHTVVGVDSFTDEMVRGPFSRWEHTHSFSAAQGGTLVRDAVEFRVLPGCRLPGSGGGRSVFAGAGSVFEAVLGGGEEAVAQAVKGQLERVFAARERRISADLSFQQRYRREPMTVVVAGASGTVGRQVTALLTGGGHTVRTLVRGGVAGENEFAWDPESGQIDEAVFEGADALIHMGGVSISQRFTAQNKRAILESRVRSTSVLARAVAQRAARGKGPRVFVCASAVGVYGLDRGDELLTEEMQAGSGFLAEVCQQWEAACAPARDAGVRVVNVRTGLVQSALGGMLRVQLPLFGSGTGGWVGNGRQMQSWVSLDDIAGIYVHAVMTESLSGPVNAVAPQPVTARELAKTVGKVLKRPVFLPIPAAGPSLLLGAEGTRELALASQNASAEKLLASGYEFFEPTLRAALEHELVL